MSGRLVDEFSDKDDGCDHTGNKTDSSNHDVEGSKTHDSAETEEHKKQREDKNTNSND